MFNKKTKLLFISTIFIFILLFAILFPGFSAPNNEENSEYKSNNELPKDQLTTSEYAALFQSVFQFVLSNYVDEVDPEKLFEGAMTGLFNSLEDPHTTYLSKTQMLDLTDTTDGEFGGLGIHIQKQIVGLDSETKSKELPYVKIISPIHGTPAYRADLKPNDYITGINGESTIDLTSDDVLDRLRGKPGTDVTITILRNKTVSFDVTLTRAIIEIPTVKSAIIDGIGYLQISQFTHHSASQTKDAIEEFNKKRVKGIIFDVRNNPGGLLTSVVDIADFIFPDGVIVSTRSRIANENSVITAKRGQIIPQETPLVILTNGGSASASEILTGVLKDRERAIVIGSKTFGKGSVQQLRSFADAGFKLTVARFYSPSGVTIDKVGIEPDIEVEEATISDLTDEQTLSYVKLLNEKTIGNYLLENNEISEEMIEDLTDSILGEGYLLPRDFLISEIRTRVNRAKENPPIYDIVNDKPLIKALEVINNL